jgi:hypothetical protein
MSTLTQKRPRVARNERPVTTIPRFLKFCSTTKEADDRQLVKRADRCADVEETNLQRQ